MRKLILTSAFSVCLLVFAFGAFDANAGVTFSTMAPCQKILLKEGNPYDFRTGYRCKGFSESMGFVNLCVCYQATEQTEFKQFLTGGLCSVMATCACDGFLDNFNTAQADFSCVGTGFATHNHLFFLWLPKIDSKGIQGTGDTSNLICSPDSYCQSACQAC